MVCVVLYALDFVLVLLSFFASLFVSFLFLSPTFLHCFGFELLLLFIPFVYVLL